MYSSARGIIFVTVLSSFIFWGSLFVQADIESDIPEKRGKIVNAFRIYSEAPKIDGYLTEEVWKKAQIISDFLQKYPDNGKEPTEKTEIQIGYDDHALYVAVRAYDSEPDKIRALLTRRDKNSQSDWINIKIDSRYDRRTGYKFCVNPAGVKRDYFLYDDAESDESWNAIWQVETRIDRLGWTAEFRIPFSILRFPQKERHLWGINIFRKISRKNEGLEWIYTPRGVYGNVSRFGDLTNLEGIKSPRQLEILPYIVAKETFDRDDTDFSDEVGLHFKSGLDAKYGLNSAFTLDMAINPDFGQVEADPSILNLSAFETFYPENRPFFIEGSSLFKTSFALFHSRRIGKHPGRFQIDSDYEILDRPDNTTILGAAKLTGKSSNGISVGVLQAVTDEEHAKIINNAENKQDYIIEPLTNYLIARIQKDILDGYSTIGIMATAVNRLHSESAYSQGLDWNLRIAGDKYNVSGQLVSSYAGQGEDRKKGYGSIITFGKRSGKLVQWKTNFDIRSPELKINDLGYIQRNDWIENSSWFQIRRQEPLGFIRESYNYFEKWLAWNYNGDNLSKRIGCRSETDFMNYWSTNLEIYYDFERSSDSDKFRGGTLIAKPASLDLSFELTTDERKTVSLSPKLSGEWSKEGDKFNQYKLSLIVKPATNIEIDLTGSYSREKRIAQWVDNIDANGDGNIDHYVYSQLDTKIFDISLEGTMTISRDLTLQLYMQPYIAVGNYSNFKELLRSGSFDFKPYDYQTDEDFSQKELDSNIVLRWEYRPGSQLYLVWTRSQSDGQNPGHFRLDRDLKKLFSVHGTDIIFIKMSYWFNL